MLQRIVTLYKAVDVWFVQHNQLDDSRLNTNEWMGVCDILDILGLFKDLTVALQSRTEPAIVYLLP